MDCIFFYYYYYSFVYWNGYEWLKALISKRVDLLRENLKAMHPWYVRVHPWYKIHFFIIFKEE